MGGSHERQHLVTNAPPKRSQPFSRDGPIWLEDDIPDLTPVGSRECPLGNFVDVGARYCGRMLVGWVGMDNRRLLPVSWHRVPTPNLPVPACQQRGVQFLAAFLNKYLFILC